MRVRIGVKRDKRETVRRIESVKKDNGKEKLHQVVCIGRNVALVKHG